MNLKYIIRYTLPYSNMSHFILATYTGFCHVTGNSNWDTTTTPTKDQSRLLILELRRKHDRNLILPQHDNKYPK